MSDDLIGLPADASWIISAICCAGFGFSTDRVNRTTMKEQNKPAGNKEFQSEIIGDRSGWICGNTDSMHRRSSEATKQMIEQASNR